MKKLLTFLTLLTLSIGVGWAAQVEDILTAQLVNASTSYSTVTYSNNASYSLNCMSNAAREYIQLKSKDNISGIVSTTSAGKVKKVVVQWATNTQSGRTLDIYGKNTAYTSASDLYGDNAGTNLGSIVYGTSTELTISGDYAYIGVRSNNGALYLAKITFTWETDGGTTVETVATPTFSPAAGTFTSAQNVTISTTTDGATIYYTTNGDDPTSTSSSIANGGTVTISESCTLKAYATKSDMNDSQIASAAYEINQPVGLPFTETFAEAAGTGPSGDSWSGSIASAGFKSDNEGWIYNNGYAGNQCARFGTGSVDGYATTPEISGFTSGIEYPMTFKAGAWNGDGTTLSLSASYGTFKDKTTGDVITSVTMLNNAWTEYEIIFVPSSISSTITFATNSKRFFLDEVNITKPLPEGDYYLVGDFNSWAEQDENYKFRANADGNFYLNGVTIAEGQEFKIMKGSTWCGGPTDNTQYCEVKSDWHTDMGIIVNGGSNYHMASGGTCYFIISDRNLLTVQIAPVAIRGTHNNWSETAMTATETGWTINNINLAEGYEFQFIDGWNVYHGGNGAGISVNDLGVALNMGTSGNYHVTVPGNYTITVNRWLNKMTADVERNTHNITTVANPNGGGDVSITGGVSATTAKYLDEVTIVAEPSNGYTLSSVVVTGNDSGNTITVTDNKFKMPDEDVTVTANFTADSYVITVESPHGTTTCPSSATVGQTVSFTVTPDDNYTVTGVTASFENNSGATTAVDVSYTDDPDSGKRTYSFGMPPFPVTVVVSYQKESSGGGDGDYVKVTTSDDLTDGEYLIVYEGDGLGYGPFAFNGALTGLDATPNTISVEINGDYTITSTPTVDAATFTITKLSGNLGYSILSASGKYIGGINGGNGFADLESTEIYINSISFDSDNNADIISYTSHLRYNATSGQDKFRYFKSSTYTAQQPVALYKKVESTAVKAPTITPEGGTFLNSENPDGITVTITPVTEGSTIYVSTDGTNYDEYNTATTITVNSTTTVTAYASKDGEISETVSETYTFVDRILDDVVFSPIPGEYSGAQTLEMYTTTQNAKIYYEISDAGEPNDPTTSSTLYSSSDVINLLPNHTYYVKAIAYVGNNCSEIASGTYTINAAASSGLNSIAELNAASTSSTQRIMNNPMQIIYMNTWRHNGTTPEYAYVRDNTGYGLVYFGNGYYGQSSWIAEGAVQNPKICEMGDWIPGGVAKGAVQVWSDGFHNELGGKNQYNTVTGWPKTSDELQNTPIIPEEMTNANINAGWDISNTFAEAFNAAFQDYCDDHNLVPENLTDDQKNAANAYAIEQVGGYSSHIQPNNVWGHYVHLRKNTIRVTTATNPADATDATRKKYGGFVTDQSGEDLIYYDGFYNFSGYNGTPDYSNDYFQEIQNNGGTFDVYGIVGFYGPYAADAEHNYIPFEIIPIDFLSIYKPIIHMDGVDYGVDSNNPSTVTKYEQQTVTLTCATEGATIWYKTSDMEDYEAYEPGTEIVVDATTTIEAYSSIPTKYNDLMESVVNSLEINMGSIEKPVISPESIVKTVGDDPVNATITCETSDATIYFTVDGSDPKDETNENRYEYTEANIAEYLTGIDETTTVRAIAFKDNFYSAEADAKTYTFVKSNGIIYDLVTDQTQLNESSVFVIVNKANNMAVGTTQNENNRSGDGVKFVDENTKTQVYGNDELAQFTLKKVGNNWYLQTTNSNVNGYLYVGDGNTLLTSATATDAAEATINIDADSEHQAHISFVYNYETTRYLRYWNGGQAFSTYTSETSNLPVSLYYVKATPLANIEKEGEVGEQYTVADQLIAVDYREYGENDVYLWCKDQGNVSIAKTSINEDNQVDFMKQQGAQEGDWDQSNWVILKLTGQTGLSKAIAATRDGEKIQPHYIAPATITGHYVNDQNYMIEVTDNEFTVGEAVTYTPNVYCTANFVPENLNIWGTDEDGAYTGDATINTQNYFFMNPKVEEFCTITWAKWDGSKFVVPSTSGFEGSFNIDLTFNEDKEVIDDLNNANANAEEGVEILYQFNAIIQHNTNGSGSSKAASSDIIVYPMDLTASSAIDPATAINTVETGNGEVKSVKYVNVAGIVSDTPFEGVNIVVTEYTDGSRTTTKMLKR